LKSYQDKSKPNPFNNYSPIMTRRHNSKHMLKKQRMKESQKSSRNNSIDEGTEVGTKTMKNLSLK